LTIYALGKQEVLHIFNVFLKP